MAEISLGSFSQQNGRTAATSGLASGLDSGALIDGILSARQLSIDTKVDTISVNENKITAIGQLQVLLERFKTSMDFLRNPPGVGNQNNDYFKHTTTSSLSSTAVAASTYIDVQSTAGAILNNYSIANITVANKHILRKDGFSSNLASVVGNSSITDNYQTNLGGTISGSVLNATTPITFANDIQANGVAVRAHLDILFGSENSFDATDSITFGATTLTFGGTGGTDLDISAASTLSAKLDVIAAYMNSVTTGDESSTNYTYTNEGSGVLRVERDTAGTIATVGTDLAVSANFSTGTTDTTQTIAFGKMYKNNGSASGSVARSNGPVSATVSGNGVPGVNASTKATINVEFSNHNQFDSGDTLVFGNTTLSFAGGGGDSLTLPGGSLAANLRHIANYMNTKVSGPESLYSFTFDGTDTIIVTRDAYGSNATVGTNLALDANFSSGSGDQTIKFGSDSAANNPAAAVLNVEGAEGVDTTSITDAKTTHTSTLAGAVNLDVTDPVFNNGTNDTDTFTPNSITFKATVGGATYTSRAVELDGGSMSGGSGLNGRGDRIAAGTVITFVKDSTTDSTEGTKDVTFQLVVGAQVTIANQAAATTFQRTTMNDWLNDTNSVTITQSPTVPVFRAGTFNLGGVDITLATGDNLEVIKTKINAVSVTSGVVADVIQVSDSNYSLVLKSSETGVVNRIFEFGDADLTDAGDPPNNTIQIGADNVSFTRIQNASNASLDIDGLTITRPTNAIDDAIDHLTFNLKTNSPGGTTITTTVSPDVSIIEQGVIDFLNTYNDLKFFIARQEERDPQGELVEDAVLGEENILRDVLRSVDAQITRTVSGLSSGALSTLFEVGIDFIDFPGSDDTPAVDDIFVLDQSTFSSRISSAFDEVRRVFAFDFTANSSDISVFSRTNNISLNNFQLDIDENLAIGSQVKVRDTNGNFLFNADYQPVTDRFGNPIAGRGGTIRGQAGTALAGLVLIYSGDGTDLITVSATQGIADRLYNVLNGLLEADGVIATEISSLQDAITQISEDIEQEERRIEVERELLLSRFTRLEAFIAEINNTLRFFDSQRAELLGNSG